MKKIILSSAFLLVLISGMFAQNTAIISSNQPIRYICAMGDNSYTKMGQCPKHKVDLIIAGSPTTAMLVDKEASKDKLARKGNDLIARKICPHGDFSDVKTGKCPNHGIELLSTIDSETSTRVNILAKNDTKALRNQSSKRYACPKGDLSSEKTGICPKHSLDLISSDNEDAIRNIHPEN